MNPVVKKLIFASIAIATLWAAAAIARNQLGIEFEPRSLRDFVAGLGAIGPIVFVALVTFRMPLGMPSQLLLVAGGLCFGTLAGTLYGALGLTASGLALFSLARFLGREWVESNIPKRLRPVFQDAGGRGGALLVGLGTGYPIGPITAYHTLSGITGMGFASFAVALLCGAMVRSALFTYFGSSLLSEARAPLLIAVALITAIAVAPLLFTRSRRYVLRLVAPSTTGTAAGNVASHDGA